VLLADRFWSSPPTDLISQLGASDHVDRVIHTGKPYQMVSLETRASRSRIPFGSTEFGGAEPTLIAGPCTVVDDGTLLTTAKSIKAAGATGLRGGAYKPATSPYSFQGLGEDALRLLRSVADEVGLGVVTEVMDSRRVDEVARYADILQIGARNMQNFDLLREVGRQRKPVLLKRAMSATIDEWLCAAEYIAREGNEAIILCERGIRTFERATRTTLDVSAIAVARTLTHLPIIADPSHAAGYRRFVKPLALAAIAAGADGLIIEVHPHPEQAIKDGAQTVSTTEFADIAELVRRVSIATRAHGDAVAL
jgi:3-deoxy-7-phosphoheptulonate synthase